VKREIPIPRRESNTRIPIVQPVAQQKVEKTFKDMNCIELPQVSSSPISGLI